MRIAFTAIGLALLVQSGSAQTFLGTLSGRDWYISTTAFTPDNARLYAEIQGGVLATVRDAGELSWIRSRIGNTIAWIGLSDRNEEGVFLWDDGDLSTFRNWGFGEPNNDLNEDSVVINWGSSGEFNDWKAWEYAPALYTRKLPAVPEPTTILGLLSGTGLLLNRKRKSKRAS